jgi:hypothetical protein
MTSGYIVEPRAEVKPPQIEPALERLWRLLSRELEAMDREAMQFRRPHTKGFAVKTFSEIVPNDDKRIVVIVADDRVPGRGV